MSWGGSVVSAWTYLLNNNKLPFLLRFGKYDTNKTCRAYPLYEKKCDLFFTLVSQKTEKISFLISKWVPKWTENSAPSDC